MTSRNESRRIIIFDGVCNFCNGAVNFIIRNDSQGAFCFVPMQADFAQHLIRRHNITNVGVDTFLLVKEGQAFIWTDAALEIAKELDGKWRWLRIFRIVPRPMRDWFYRLFARNRYALFGRSKTCMVPTEAVKERFIDGYDE